MADDIVISILAKAAENLLEPIKRQGQYFFCANKFMRSIENKKRELTSTRDGMQKRIAEANKKTEKIENAVEKWLNEVETLLEEVESLVQEVKANKGCFPGWCPRWGTYLLSKQMAKKIKILTDLNNNSKFEPFSRLASLPTIEFFSSGNFSFFESTKLAYNQLLEAIQENSTYMIGLYGMGGSGKTTLIKEVGKRAKELKHFDVVVFTTVSQTPNVTRIQDEIADMVGLKLDERSEAGRARRISLRLQSGERILLILDDVWTKLNLENIGIPYDGNTMGCKVILTTRRQQVCTLMDCQRKIPLDLLSEEETWTLFQKHAGIDADDFQFLHGVPREVAAKCKGLPIAIEAVGTSLKGKSIDEWKVALKRLRDSKPLDIEEGVRDAFTCLQLSYDYLRSKEAKSLLLVCSMFPENHDIFIEDLFRYGIGWGLCGEVKSLEEARNQVNAAINNLLDSCLLMHSEKRDDHLKMHDMVRDVALWIASKENCTILVNPPTDLNALAEDEAIKECSALSWWYKDIEQLPNQLDAPKLEILLLNTTNSLELSYASFEGIKATKVVALIAQHYYMGRSTSLPQSTQILTNLRTLRLVRWELGDISSIVCLGRLEILDLRGSCFKELPNGIEKLNKLKLLDLSWCGIKEPCYQVIRRCSQLQELYLLGDCFYSGTIDASERFMDNFSYAKLQRYALQIGEFESDISLNLEDLSTGVLYITKLNPSTTDAFTRNLLQRAGDISMYEVFGGCKSFVPCIVQDLGGMKELTKLFLHSCSEMECLIDTTSDDAVLFQSDVVFPRLVKVQLWFMHTLRQVCHGPPAPWFFEKLEELHIWHCLQLQSIFSGEWSLCSLKILSVYNCPRLTSLFLRSAGQTLLQLEELIIRKCNELKHIIDAETGTSTGEEISQVEDNFPLMLPKLKILSVRSCCKLECAFPVSWVHSLVELSIVKAPEMKYIFGQYGQGDHLSLQNEMHIKFPLLEVLELKGLTNLLGICEENYQISFPSLREQHCMDCPKFNVSDMALRHLHLNMDGKNDGHCSIEVEILSQLLDVINNSKPADTSDLQEKGLDKDQQELMVGTLSQLLDNIKNGKAADIFHLQGAGIHEEPQEFMASMLDRSQLRTLSEPKEILCLQHLPSLQVIEVNNHRKLKYVFTPVISKSLLELRQLIISDCEELEYLIAEDEKCQTEVCFPNLREIKVMRCNNLRSLFTATITIMLPQLKSLCIDEAAQLQEVFGHKGEDGSSISKEIVLPKLREIKLKQLPSLVDFCGGCKLHMLELQKVLIHGCPQLDSIIGVTTVICRDRRAKEQQSLVKNDGQVYSEVSNLRSASNLIKPLPIGEEKRKIMTSSVEWLYLKHLPDLRFIRISNLYFLKVRRCAKLKSIFSATAIRSLPRLKYLDIGDCDELEEIISDIEFEEEPSEGPSSNFYPQQECFPNLIEVFVQRCRNLKFFFSVKKRASGETHDCVIEFVLPKVQELKLENLPSLTDICGGFQFQLQLPSLESYEINDCPNFSSTTIAALDNFWRARQSQDIEEEEDEDDDDSDFFDEDEEEEESEDDLTEDDNDAPIIDFLENNNEVQDA